ncbi:hypothetical protein F5Y09DRAFT_171321 [Xylaria sp. FL1042]|nr:hypothetical protein F5Y09DRAFT_171321 [Xylaria sp. FL1042]
MRPRSGSYDESGHRYFMYLGRYLCISAIWWGHLLYLASSITPSDSTGCKSCPFLTKSAFKLHRHSSLLHIIITSIALNFNFVSNALRKCLGTADALCDVYESTVSGKDESKRGLFAARLHES